MDSNEEWEDPLDAGPHFLDGWSILAFFSHLALVGTGIGTAMSSNPLPILIGGSVFLTTQLVGGIVWRKLEKDNPEDLKRSWQEHLDCNNAPYGALWLGYLASSCSIQGEIKRLKERARCRRLQQMLEKKHGPTKLEHEINDCLDKLNEDLKLLNADLQAIEDDDSAVAIATRARLDEEIQQTADAISLLERKKRKLEKNRSAWKDAVANHPDVVRADADQEKAEELARDTDGREVATVELDHEIPSVINEGDAEGNQMVVINRPE